MIQYLIIFLAEFLQSVGQSPEFPVDGSHVLHDLRLGVEQLDALSVGVVTGGEHSRIGGRKVPESVNICMERDSH